MKEEAVPPDLGPVHYRLDNQDHLVKEFGEEALEALEKQVQTAIDKGRQLSLEPHTCYNRSMGGGKGNMKAQDDNIG